MHKHEKTQMLEHYSVAMHWLWPCGEHLSILLKSNCDANTRWSVIPRDPGHEARPLWDGTAPTVQPRTVGTTSSKAAGDSETQR